MALYTRGMLQEVPHVNEESEGIHDMVFRSRYVEIFIPKLFG